MLRNNKLYTLLSLSKGVKSAFARATPSKTCNTWHIINRFSLDVAFYCYYILADHTRRHIPPTRHNAVAYDLKLCRIFKRC